MKSYLKIFILLCISLQLGASKKKSTMQAINQIADPKTKEALQSFYQEFMDLKKEMGIVEPQASVGAQPFSEMSMPGGQSYYSSGSSCARPPAAAAPAASLPAGQAAQPRQPATGKEGEESRSGRLSAQAQDLMNKINQIKIDQYTDASYTDIFDGLISAKSKLLSNEMNKLIQVFIQKFQDIITHRYDDSFAFEKWRDRYFGVSRGLNIRDRFEKLVDAGILSKSEIDSINEFFKS